MSDLEDVDEQEWDDEVEAAASAPGRASSPVSAFASETPDRQVVCMDCHCTVTLSGFAWEFAKQASNILVSRGEQPLRNDEMTRCQDCADRWHLRRREWFASYCEKVSNAQCEANTTGRVDEELVAKLREHKQNDWADGIEAGAARFHASQASRGRSMKERK